MRPETSRGGDGRRAEQREVGAIREERQALKERMSLLSLETVRLQEKSAEQAEALKNLLVRLKESQQHVSERDKALVGAARTLQEKDAALAQLGGSRQAEQKGKQDLQETLATLEREKETAISQLGTKVALGTSRKLCRRPTF